MSRQQVGVTITLRDDSANITPARIHNADADRSRFRLGLSPVAREPPGPVQPCVCYPHWQSRFGPLDWPALVDSGGCLSCRCAGRVGMRSPCGRNRRSIGSLAGAVPPADPGASDSHRWMAASAGVRIISRFRYC